jgi:hypothetical protein
VVGPEERLEARALGPPSDFELLGVGQPLLGLDHQNESHASSLRR